MHQSLYRPKQTRAGECAVGRKFGLERVNREYVRHWHESRDSQENTKTFCLSSFSLAVLLIGEARDLPVTIKHEIVLEQLI
jgi:hypothetical protein